MVLLKREIEEHQSEFEVIRADTDSLSEDTSELYNEVFDRDFMRQYTVYSSIDRFFEESPAGYSDPHAAGSTSFNEFVSTKTVFDDWEEMKQKAKEEWLVSEMNW